MELTVKGSPKEIAALVIALQERQSERGIEAPQDIIQKAVQSVIVNESSVHRDPVGPRGPYGAIDEADLVRHLIGELEQASNHGGYRDSDENVYQPVDSFVLLQTIGVLKSYQKLLA